MVDRKGSNSPDTTWPGIGIDKETPVAFYIKKKYKNCRKCTVWTKAKTCVISTILKKDSQASLVVIIW